MNPVKLKTGEVICDKCNGLGIFCYAKSKHVTLEYCTTVQCSIHKCCGFQRCLRCQGEGKLDWIENIIGEKKYSFLYKDI